LKQEIDELDKTKSGLIDYADYMNYAFELDVKKLEEKLAANKKSYTNQVDYENDKRIHLLYLIEHAKWSYFNTAAQRSPLNYEQFYMFKYSFVFKDFHDYEARKIFEIFDTNQNGYLDKKELEYLIEDYDETAAKSAKNQLTIKENNKCCDEDKDEQLSRGEVVRHCRQLINSRLTNYGLDLNRNDLDSVLNDPKDLKDEL
jgi:Ca2+-binding EF-hand superfamily protein